MIRFGDFDFIFQSTPPVKAATIKAMSKAIKVQFQSTPPVKAATDDHIYDMDALEISIHAAREGGDVVIAGIAIGAKISIHAAREGGDVGGSRGHSGTRRFQSTPPVKAATFLQLLQPFRIRFQSTPPVKAATDTATSTHTAPGFQSTPPVKAATAETNRRNQHFRKQQV